MKKTTLSNCRALRLLATALLLLTVSVSANAYSFSATNNGVTIYYNRSGSNATVTYESASFNSYSGNVVIPETVTYGGTTYTVTSIGYAAFYGCTGLTSVTIPNSVTSIGGDAFYGCTGLTEITIPESVTSIGSSAFYGCTGLIQFEVAEGSEYFCSVDGVLYSKDMTTLVAFPGGSPLLPSFAIPNSVTSIGSRTFYNCSGLTSVTIPNSVTSIGSYAFYGCTGLTEITIPESVTSIGSDAFRNCTGLTQVNYNAISCTCGEETGVFYGCDKLATINIGENVTIIPMWFCAKLESLTSINIPNSVTSIGYGAFEYCSGLTELTIPNSVTEIGGYAFEYCRSLSSITIPNSVTSIGSYAFYGCTGLTQFDVADGNEYYCSVDGVLFTKDMTMLIQFPAASSITSYNIPESVTTIGQYAFDCCTGLTSVTIGNSVTSIGSDAFYCCSGLMEVNFNATACTSAGSSSCPVFGECSNLKTANIGDNVISIPSCLFYKCTWLIEVTIPNSVTSIGESAFYGCTGLIEVTFEDGEETLTMTTSSSATPFTNCPLKTVYLGRNLSFSSSSYSAFRNNTSLASLTIGEKVTNIPNDAFYGCSGLYSISNTSKTQSTCKMRITSNISGAESGVYYNSSFYSVDDDRYYTFTDLIPGTSYSFYFGIKLDNGSSSRHGDSKSVTTTEINPQITQVSLTPESFTATGSYKEGDAEVTETGFTGYTSDGVTLYLTNLEPKTQYTVEYYVTASGKKFTTSTTFRTLAVEFTTLPAKATSNTVALLGATTNLSDDAVGAGFEWRRYDAPSTMPSNQAECPVIDGELTGTLNGLSATTYYDFRPYYTSQGGTTYYGDWMTFITADAYVYFEPTVRTYSATSVGSSSATVKAYAVAGSDNITSQGFEYWQGGSSSAMNVRRASTTDENGVTRVEVSGQWMTATLEDLEPSTTYSYRAYVTTAVGTTYGETMSFTTDVPTGIEGTKLTEDAEVYEIARYTLDGRKVSQPQRGMNIIRYSDGTSKKVLVK